MATKTNKLSWGRCEISLKKVGDTSGTAKKLPQIPVENSTKLTKVKGDTQEAKVEGGGIFASRVSKGSYDFATQFYVANTSTMKTWFGGVTEGQIPDDYEVTITPEDTEAPVVKLARVSMNLSLEYATEKGILLNVEGKVLEPESGDMVDVSGTAG